MTTTGTNTQPPTAAEVWSTGDYAAVCDRMIPDLGASLVRIADPQPQQLLLDVAAGTGNAALRAAAIGADVTAIDITPELLQIGAGRAEDAGLEISWVEGNAQALPFADATFDHVISCVGVQFCADRAAAAEELLRVCRPGGRITLISWTPDGFIGQVLAAVTRATGAPAPPPALGWGFRDTIRELFGSGTRAQRFTVDSVIMPAQSAEEWVDFMATAYGPLVRARAALTARGTWSELESELVAIAKSHDTGDGRGFRSEYLAAVLER